MSSQDAVRLAEIQLIAAAIADHRGCAPEWCGGSNLDPCALMCAIDRLLTACPDCDRGTHLCPGDGKSIPHGATDCGYHFGPEDDGAMRDELVAVEQAQQELGWWLRRWEDVRQGDTVKLPDSEAAPAYVASAIHLTWHVKPGTGTSAYNPPFPLDWAAVRVTLADRAPELAYTQSIRPLGTWDMDPVKPILIQLTQIEADALDLMGWNNRAGLITEQGK